MKFDWKEAVRNIAPAIGGVLGGPVPAVALKYIAEKVLGEPELTPEETELQVVERIKNGDPEIFLKLKQSDQDFAIRLQELGLDKYALSIKDRQSARQLFSVNIWPQMILTGLFTVGYFTLLFIVVTGRTDIPADVRTLADLIVGVLTAGQVKVMDFWFGSSYGSKEKSAALSARIS